MEALSGQGVIQLSDVLSKTLNSNELAEFVQASTGDRLYVEYVGEGKPLKPTIVDLLNALVERGSTPVFLRYVYDHRPGRKDVRELIARLCPEALGPMPEGLMALSAQTAGQRQPDAPISAFAPGLQRNVRPYLAKLDIRIWLERLIQIERRVCRIEFNGEAMGTGFLVGPDTVLTNWHVVEGFQSARRIVEIGCRFDYVQLPDRRLQVGQLVPLHADGCLNWSRYSDSERMGTLEGSLPTSQELDYALLRLASPVGQHCLNGATRGWVVLPIAPFPLPNDAPLLIVQHPEGAPMKLALDTQAVIGRNRNGTRICYKTNTDPGSSGSPCFTMDWDIVALHNYGDPKWHNPRFNQGVPIELIRLQIESQGLGKTLGT
jgi:Trypsin-like peptidase domain